MDLSEIGGYFEELPRDILESLSPYAYGDWPLYEKIANDIYNEIILDPKDGFKKPEFLNSDAIINDLIEKLTKMYGFDNISSLARTSDLDGFQIATTFLTRGKYFNYYPHDLPNIFLADLTLGSTGSAPSHISPRIQGRILNIIHNNIMSYVDKLRHIKNIIQIYILTERAGFFGSPKGYKSFVYPHTTIKDIYTKASLLDNNASGRRIIGPDSKLLDKNTTIEEAGIENGGTIVFPFN